MANLYFIGETDSHTNDVNNWATSSGGTTHPAAIPGASDTAYFDGNSPSALVDAAWSVGSVDCTGYTNTLTLGANLTVSGNLTFVAGMTFTPSTYTVFLKESGTLTSGGKSFYNLTGGTSGSSTHVTITLGDNTTVTNQLDLVAAGCGYDVTWNSNKLLAQGKVTMSATSTSSDLRGSTTVEFSGSGNQDFDTAAARHLCVPFIVNKSGGTVTALSTANFWFAESSSWTATTGTVDFTTNTTTVQFGYDANASSVTMTTQHDWYNVEIRGVLTLNTDITVNGYLYGTRSDGGDCTINGAYKVYLEGNLKITNDAAGTDLTGTSTIEFSGSGNHSWKTPTNAGSDYNISIIINKSGNTLTLESFNFGAANTPTMTYTAGTVDAGTSTLSIQGSCTLNTNGINWYNITHSATNTTTLSSDLDVLNDITISGATTISGTKTIALKGNWTNSSTFNAGTCTVRVAA